MSPKEAIQILDNICSQITCDESEKLKIQLAIKTLSENSK